MKEDEDAEIRSFVERITKPDQPSTSLSQIKMGDFYVFTNFLKALIGTDRTNNIETGK